MAKLAERAANAQMDLYQRALDISLKGTSLAHSVGRLGDYQMAEQTAAFRLDGLTEALVALQVVITDFRQAIVALREEPATGDQVETRGGE